MEFLARNKPQLTKMVMIVAFAGAVLFSFVGLARELVVTSTADSGTRSFRWALQTARSGDTITFDATVFPPSHPVRIYPRSELPPISCGRLTIDASNAGVIIDGSNVPGDWNNGLQVYSDRNTVMGMQIVNFAGSGIVVGGGKRNTIGGDRTVGSRPIGQGNLLCGNGIGINLCDVGTYDNAVLGNLIGVAADGTTPWGNRDFGVFVEDNVHDNVIGPGNVIANNNQGIVITGARALRNRITRNGIHSNAASGISLWSGGNAEIDAPVITDFNLEVGAVSGLTCAGCRVELFSDSEREGAIYEGDALADESGWFSFSRGTPLEGPGLTATAMDSQNNTSPFSDPTRGTGETSILQTKNDVRKQLLVTNSSSELADNRIGGMWHGLWQSMGQSSWGDILDIFTRQIIELGLKRVRLTINNLEQVTAGEYLADMSQPEMSVIPAHDALFTMVAEAGVEITYTLTFWDKESPYTEEVLSGPRFQTEDQVARYLEFARFIVKHFKGRVVRFEIWNEPDLGAPGQHIDIDNYIEVVRRVIPVIRSEWPDALIQVGGTTGLRNQESRNYLDQILHSDIMPLVDVISWHPLYGESPLHEPAYYYTYPSIVREIKTVAESHGFAGEYEADEMVWWTHGEINDQPWRYSTIESAKYSARTVLLHLGMDVTAGLGGISERPDVFATIQNLCTVMAGHKAIDIPVEIDIDYNGPGAYCAFLYPNGDRMLAVWTDGVAQDEDPGVPATITFPGLTAEMVTGIDVLHGFEQELNVETDSGSTVIRGLLVKDYPILIRLSDVTMSPDYVETIGDGFHRLGDINALPSSRGGGSDRDGDGVPDDQDYCPDWPGSKEANGC